MNPARRSAVLQRMPVPTPRLRAITAALQERGFTGWEHTTWATIHDATHVLDLRLKGRKSWDVSWALTTLPTPELVRAECLALAVCLMSHKDVRHMPSERNVAGQLWLALAPSKRPHAFRNRANRRPSQEAIRSRIRRAKRSAYARTIVAMLTQLGGPVVALPPSKACSPADDDVPLSLG